MNSDLTLAPHRCEDEEPGGRERHDERHTLAAYQIHGATTDTFQLARQERPARQSDKEITLFKSCDGGHEDLGTAQYLLSKLSKD